MGSGVKGYINNIMDELYFVYDLDDDNNLADDDFLAFMLDVW